MGVVSKAVIQWASRSPDKLAIVQADGGSLTYSELNELVSQIAGNLQQRLQSNAMYNLSCFDGQNPPVLLIARDSVFSIAAVLAINVLGLSLAPMNSGLAIAPLCAARDAINAGVVLHDIPSKGKAALLRSDTCQPVLIDDLLERNSHDLQPIVSETEYPYLLTLSSGSTGDPKPVIYTDAGKVRRAESTAAEFGFTREDTVLCASPFFHSLGQRLTFMPLVLGATMVLLPRFTASGWLDAVEQSRTTVTICVSSHLFALKDSLLAGDHRANTIRALVSSSASIDHATKSALFDRCKFQFFEMYGASEVATATSLGSTDPLEKRLSVGRACHGVDIRIVDADSCVVDADTTGEILIRSPLGSPGYYRRADLTQAAFHDGWFRTGDLGYLDADGYLYFVDRTSDVVISGGSNVFPSDVESCLRKHPDVHDCLVIGVKDSYLGEAVVAVVVARPGMSGSIESSLRRHSRQSLSSTQQPMMYFFVGELPHNGAGKVDRKLVREQYNDMGLDPSARFSMALMSQAVT